MKAFLLAVTVILLLVGAVILVSSLGIARIDAYREALPEEEAPLPVAAEALESLGERVKDEVHLVNLVFPHDRIDTLNAAIARTAAAARAEDRVEYRIHLAELKSFLYDMKRDLRLDFGDII